MKKYSTDELYVACHYYDHTELIEPWIQYESFGQMDHHIIVSPKRSLLVSKVIDGRKRFFREKDMQEVYIDSVTCSYSSHATCTDTVFLSGYPVGSLWDRKKEYFEYKNRTYCFLLTLREYFMLKLGKNIDAISLEKVKLIIKMLNTFEGRPFILSFDQDEAKEKIDKRILGKKKQKN